MDVSTISSVSKVKAARSKGYFLIVVTLQLFHQTVYLSYTMRPIPIPHWILRKFQSLTILPEQEYLVTDPENKQYFINNKNLFSNSKPIGKDLPCYPEQSIRSTEEPENVICEMKLLSTQSQTDLRTCNIRTMPRCQTKWIKLDEENSWAYSTCKEEQVQTILSSNDNIEVFKQDH